MKYKAIVVANQGDELPAPGYVRVVCPVVFGFDKIDFKNKKRQALLADMTVSGWIQPMRVGPTDNYVPEIGEGVFIEKVDTDEWIWFGTYAATYSKNLIGDYDVESGNLNCRSVLQDRVIGTRGGSYVLLEDMEGGSIIIESGARNIDNPGRVGCTLILESIQDKEAIRILGRNKDASKKSFIDIDMLKNGEKILWEDCHGNKIISDKDGIKVIDKHNNKINLKSDGLEIDSAKGDKVSMLDGIVIKAKTVIVDGETTLKTSDAAAWCPNTLTNCLWAGVPHGGAGAGIQKLKGG